MVRAVIHIYRDIMVGVRVRVRIRVTYGEGCLDGATDRCI